jgi:CO/xanthine dehydrogenase Mo-binding subunit
MPQMAPRRVLRRVQTPASQAWSALRCIYVEGSGCYGRNGHEDVAGDAVLAARAVGRPVRVQRSRADEHGWDPKGPPTLIDLKAGLDADGKVSAWSSQFLVPEGEAGNVPLVAASVADLPHETTCSPGNVIQTVSRVLMEEVKFARSAVTSLDWSSYPILTFPDVPQVRSELIDRPSEKPWGAGEPSAAIVPAAISNAIFDAAGVRMRSVPFTSTKVKAALEGV